MVKCRTAKPRHRFHLFPALRLARRIACFLLDTMRKEGQDLVILPAHSEPEAFQYFGQISSSVSALVNDQYANTSKPQLNGTNNMKMRTDVSTEAVSTLPVRPP
ncbi:hypothetical protein ACRALDRAFT_208567 [Sodiomyces alcalophilus JCM 7366]|uniref:uncharacterized protein n=1 Tax=Sodiomyces alcalophilus JCM 7366 TaxID=591952 RepID=UPI0039B65647